MSSDNVNSLPSINLPSPSISSLPPKSPRVIFCDDDKKKHDQDDFKASLAKLWKNEILYKEMFDLLIKRLDDMDERIDALECFAQDVLKQSQIFDSSNIPPNELEIHHTSDDDIDEKSIEAFDKTFQEWHLHTVKENEKSCGQAPSELRKYSTSEKNQFISSGWDDKKINWIAYRDGRRLYWIPKIL